MPEWLVQPEWDEGDETAVGTGEVIEAPTADEAREFYLTQGDGSTSKPTWISARPVDECRPGAVQAGRTIAARNRAKDSDA